MAIDRINPNPFLNSRKSQQDKAIDASQAKVNAQQGRKRQGSARNDFENNPIVNNILKKKDNLIIPEPTPIPAGPGIPEEVQSKPKPE